MLSDGVSEVLCLWRGCEVDLIARRSQSSLVFPFAYLHDFHPAVALHQPSPGGLVV